MIEMMEYWNSGKMGTEILNFGIKGPATDGNDGIIKMAYILLKTNIPAFHHSIIPFSGRIRNPKHLYIISRL